MYSSISSDELRQALPALHRFAYSLTRSHDRSADLVQDCVERCLRKQHLFDGENLRAWMFTICRRVFLNELRREKARGTSVDIDEAPHRTLSMDASQEDSLHFREVVGGFRALPKNDRMVLSLVAIEGLRYEDAAAVLDVPVGTVRSRLSRARSRLRELIENAAGSGTDTALAV